MRKYIALVILGLVALSACEDETIIFPADEQQNRIRVVGAVTITTSPDIATASLGVQTFDREVEPAVDDNNRKAEAIIEALLGQGVEEKDVKTTSFNIYPQRDYTNNNPNEIIGYQVNNTVSVTLRDLDSVGKALQKAIDAGANTVSSLIFTLDDPEPIRQQARTKAIEDARERAESMATAAGIELGKVVNISELSAPGPIIYRAELEDAAYKSGVPVQPGELGLTVQVELVFAIL